MSSRKVVIFLTAGFIAAALISLIASSQEIPAPNRARWATVSASSIRLPRYAEIARSRNALGNLTLALPQTRPRLVPRYAIDGSPLTFWASDGAESWHWIELDFQNSQRGQVMVAAVAVTWGRDHGIRYKISTTPDLSFWKPAYIEDRGNGGIDLIRFSPPIPVSALRLEIEEGPERGVSLEDIAVYGDPAEPVPAPVIALAAEALGPGAIRLKWSQEADQTTYFYNVYRARGEDPRPVTDNLIKTTCNREIADAGLQPGTEYRYLVVAETFGGRRAESSIAAAQTAPGAAGRERWRFRGVVEGFYNDPWPHQERLRMFTFMEDAGFNYYIYAPKTEPYHRQLWREPYPEAELENFTELVKRSQAHGLTFSYGISPGLDFKFHDGKDLEALTAKLQSLAKVGVRSFTICFDDIPGAPSRIMAKNQIEVVNEVFARLRADHPKAELLFVPTVYSGVYSRLRQTNLASARYLSELKTLNPEIGIFWTGPGLVFSAEIGLEPAQELADLWDRKILIWDNYNANDGAFRFNLFTGPYSGRAPDLDQAADGIFLNPSYLPNAAKIFLYTAGRYFNGPDYEAWAAYDEAIRFIGGSDAGARALKTISDCLTPHPIFPELTLEGAPAFQAIETFWNARLTRSGEEEARAGLRALFTAFAKNPEDIKKHFLGAGMYMDLAPVSEKLALYGQAGLKCLTFMEEPDPALRLDLRRDILALQGRARLLPWRVLDEQAAYTYRLIGARPGRRSVMDDFITRVLAEFR